MSRIIILTWPSGSWKTTLQEKMLETGKWKRPLNCTTRQPRSDKELDEYVFLSKEQFLLDLERWYFLEHTNYNWNYYWVLNFVPKEELNYIIILDPVWRSMASEYFVRNNIEFETFYLEITPEEQEQRLIKRGDSEEERIRRSNDFKWFSPTPQCKILSWNNSIECLIRLIENE